jgi:CubicO group peptidase (beta-lactamase class C family)
VYRKGLARLCTALLCTSVACVAADFPFPTDAPAHHGLSREGLDRWRERLAILNTRALLVVRDDRIVYEWYAPGSDANKKQGTASLAKAIVGGNSLMVALEDGRLRADDLASTYIPAWRNDPQKSKITIRQLATHTSGIEDAEQDGIDHMQLPGWKGAFWRRDPDPFSIAVHQTPVVFPPGTSYAYSNPGMAALAYAVTASLRGAPQANIRTLLKERLFDPLGIPESHWSIGYGQGYSVDGLELYANWGGGSFTPRATARIGQLMLHEGEWEGKRLVHRAVAQRMVAYAGMPIQRRTPDNPGPASGLCWWLNYDGVWPDIPRDAFGGAGAGQELLLVVPSLNLIVVRNGALLKSQDRFWGDAVDEVFNPLVAMARSKAPYPHSAHIDGVTFGPESTIVRRALDSDNWPITWGDDDAQYTSYGDGKGFEPLLPVKLSMGIAKVTGSPDNFQGINIRSATGERTGDGAKGAKASGMLMVDGVLYMWVRNTGNAQIAWSEDHGRTWQWGFKLSTSFGSPVFLNFGPNYAGARDGFVYTYSQDGASAYEANDSLVLARVPKASIRNRDAYEFFAGLDAGGHPEWTRDIAARGPVFSFRGHCQRADAVYNPLLKRYLLALGYNHKGGWGMFDAPEPWGPWTTVFHTDYWGLGGTHGYRLPAKWIGPAANQMTLVFSGVALPGMMNDAFCVRRMTLDLRNSGAARLTP